MLTAARCTRRLREASLAQQLLLQTLEDRRVKLQALMEQVRLLEIELQEARAQGKCVVAGFVACA